MCWCAYAPVCVWVPMHMYACVSEGHWLVPGVFLNPIPPQILRVAGQKTPEILLSLSLQHLQPAVFVFVLIFLFLA